VAIRRVIIYRFFHYLGFALWMGGGWSTMALVIRTRSDTSATRIGLFRILPAAFNIMALGAILTAASGIGLAASLARLGFSARLGETGVTVMMGTGFLGAVMMLAIGFPTSRKLARLAASEALSPEFEKFRRRLAMSSSVAGVLGVLALIGATLM
jgi:hypothetical protein